MYILTNHNAKIAEWTSAQNLRGLVADLDAIIETNKRAKQVMEEKDSGRPGHYYGRDIVIEGEMPVAVFHAAALEFDGDADWWKDDTKFQSFMVRHPEYNWLKR